MMETELELTKLGVPVKTRHNEVAPNQFELAPMFEGTNVGCDHQMLTMQIMQNVARNYGLVCLLHEKPFAGVNGSGKHNNWSMGTDTGDNLLEPGDTPQDNLSFLFFAAAVIEAVDTYQELLRASVASPGQDFRLGANEAPPAIISIFLGTELEEIFGAIAAGKATPSRPGSFLGLGTPVLPALPLHSGDRNRTSPFAFTGNKFEFRALGSSMSPGWPNTILNTIASEAIDRMSSELEAQLKGGATLEKAILAIVKSSYKEHSRVVFNGDGYSQEWHDEAAKRGLANLRSTVDALPWIVDKTTIDLFKKHKVLTKRELEARYDVYVEQYSTKVNIEAEVAASIARTLLLPAALRHLTELKAAGVESLVLETEALVDDLVSGILALEKVNLEHPEVEGIEHATYMRDSVLPAMETVRESADKLERIVADDLWPLPKYAEMLFIK
jgi:glutamine synthetase